MLKRPSPRRWQTGLSSALLLALFTCGGYAAWAQQPAVAAASPDEDSRQYSVVFEVNADGEQRRFEMREAANAPLVFAVDTKAGRHWVGTFRIAPNGQGEVTVNGKLDGGPAGGIAHELTTRMGQRASMALDGRSPDGASLGHFGVAFTVAESNGTTTGDTAEAPDGSDDTHFVMRGDVRMTTPGAGAPTMMEANAVDVAQGDAGARIASRLPPPTYPKDAADAGVTGRVVVLVDVAVDGSPVATTIESSKPAGVFDSVVLQAVRSWKFSPAMKDGKPVAGRVRVPIDFDMDSPEEVPGQSSAVHHSDYVWFKQKNGEPLPTELRCDVLTGTNSKEGPQDLACGIRKPAAGKVPAGKSANVAPQARNQVLAEVAPDGTVSNVRLDTDRKPGALEQAMIKAITSARLEPAMQDGQAVARTVAFDVVSAPPGSGAGR